MKKGTGKTVTVQSCWSTHAPATHTACFSVAGWRRASAVSLSDSDEASDEVALMI